MNEFQKAQNAKILSCYNTDEALSELQKAEIIDIEKGGKRALIGEKRTFGGREYIKTSDGWKFHGKGTGTKAQEHVAGSKGASGEDTLLTPENREKDPTIDRETREQKEARVQKELDKLDAEESISTDSHSAAEIKKKALEIMRAKGGKDIKLSDFTIRQAKQVIKEHEMLGSKEASKTEKVAEEKIRNVLNSIQEQTGLKLKVDSNSGIKTMKREKYFNVLLDQRVSESEDYPKLERFANKYKTIRVEPNGHKRVAIFFK